MLWTTVEIGTGPLAYVRHEAPIPGCPLGARYIITETWDSRWSVGVSLRRWDGSYWTGADLLYGGQPTHATWQEAARWTERRNHRRWARLVAEKAARVDANIAKGFLG